MAEDKRFSIVLEVIMPRRTGQQNLIPATMSGFCVKESITWSLKMAKKTMVVPQMVELMVISRW